MLSKCTRLAAAAIVLRRLEDAAGDRTARNAVRAAASMISYVGGEEGRSTSCSRRLPAVASKAVHCCTSWLNFITRAMPMPSSSDS